jgi:hypothetical protein
MGDSRISALPAVSSVVGTDEVAVIEAGASKMATVAQIQTFIGAVPASVLATGAAAPTDYARGANTFNGTVDPDIRFGYNVYGEVGSEPIFAVQLEGDYNNGTHHMEECYLEYWSPDHTTIQRFRPIFFGVQRDDNSSHAAQIQLDIGSAGSAPLSVLYINAGSIGIASMTETGVTFWGSLKVGSNRVLTVADGLPGSGNIIPAAGAGTTTGPTITLTSTETQAIGDAVQIDSSGHAHLGKADTIGHASAVLLAAAAVSGSAASTYLLPGGTLKLASSPSWTAGGLVYLTITGTTGNTLSQTPPSATNNSIQVLGVALAADTILFMPSLVQVEHA